MSDRSIRLSLLVPLAAVSLAIGACGQETLSSSEIESQASAKLSEKVGQTPKSIDCPDDLDAEVGAKETCTLTADDGTTYDMTVEITSVDGDKAQFDFQVADKPNN